MGFLEGLNSAQRKAAEDLDGPSLILAGAGSGKTRTLTHRAAWILHQNRAPAERVLVVTFTNKAARELRDRLNGLVGEDEASKVWAMTFHALCLRMLRQSGPIVGVGNDFTVLDAAATRKLLQSCADEIDDPAAEDPQEMRKVRSLISRAKNAGHGPEVLSGPLGARTGEIWKAYRRQCQEINALDFDDILLKARDLLNTEQGSATWGSRFSFVMVDEYQDVNQVQEEILKGLCRYSNNLCVVGDDSQSVYAFRGAEVQHILTFANRWPNCTVHKLEDNYRSSASVLEAAQAIIERARDRSDKRLIPTRPQGQPVRLIRFENWKDEADFVADRIQHLLAEGVQPEEIAIVYRMNAQSQPIEEALARRAIAYQVLGGVSFINRAEVQNARAWMAMLTNPQDRMALERAASFPRRGVGPAAIRQVVEKAQGGDLLQAAEELIQSGELKGKAGSGMKGMLTVLSQADLSKPLGEVLQSVLVRSGMVNALKKDKQSGLERLANLDALQETAERYPGPAQDSISDWLTEMVMNQQEEGDRPEVKLMTLHAAKGLEFRYVFMIGLEEELFLRGDVGLKQLEEERRLLYVGMTRAEHELVMSLADKRRLWGREGRTQPLQFLFDLPPSVVKNRVSSRRPPAKTPARSQAQKPTGSGAPASSFKPGSMVRHPIFGLGRIVDSSEQGVEVQFMGRSRTLKPDYPHLSRA